MAEENQRTTIVIEDAEGGKLRVRLGRAPSRRSGSSRFLPPLDAELDPEQATEATAQEYGAALHAKLRAGDRKLRHAMRDALRASNEDVRPLCFKIEGEPSLVDAWMWEVLWVRKKQFLALQPQWPIARLVESGTTARVYHAPVRMLAIMSALGVPARGDWEGIRRAVEAARRPRPGRGEGDKLPIHLTVLAAEPKLVKELNDYRTELAARGESWLNVVSLDSQETVEEHLAGEPHIVHFFCHGRLEYGGGILSLATRSDRAEEDPSLATSSVTVDLARLGRLVNGRKLWLVTLNCCLGGASSSPSSGPIQSLAKETVDAGAGAALGWRTAIAPESAHVLSQSVYAAFFRDLRDRLNPAQPEDTVPIELATLGSTLRAALHNKHRDLLTWALPVLYVAQEPLSVIVTAAKPDDVHDLGKTEVSRADAEVISQTVGVQTLREAMQANRDLAEFLVQRLGPDLRQGTGDEAGEPAGEPGDEPGGGEGP